MSELPPMVNYFNEQTRVVIEVPEEWEGQIVNERQFRIFGPPAPEYDDYQSTMSYLRTQPEQYGRQWLASYVAQIGQQMEHEYNQFQQSGEDWFELDGPATGHVRFYEWQDEETGLHFSQFQSLILVDQYALYVVNAATLKPLEETYMPIFRHILDSTRIVPPHASDHSQ